MVELPTPVKRQLEEIERLYAPAEVPAEAAAEEGQQVVPTPETPAPAPVQDAETPVEAAEPAEQEVKPAPAPAQEPEGKVWEHRYKTLQGLHNQQMADMKSRLKDRDRQMADLQKQVAELQVTKAAPTVDQKDVETFGEDLIAAVQRVVDARLGATGAQVDSRFAQVESQLQGATSAAAQTAEMLFLERLGGLVPDYQEINLDQGFLDWLAESDEVYGVPRQDALDRAAGSLDAQRVARVFQAYKATLAPVAQPTDPQVRSPKSQLEKQVAPRASSSPSPQAPAPKRSYSAADVQKFYDDVAKGRYAYRQDEMNREEAAINAALAEGRIR